MPQPQVKHALERLRQDLQGIDAHEGATPQEITEMLSHVNSALDHFDEPEHHETLLRHLQDVILRFEVDHPQLSLQINNVIQGLTNSGL